MVIIAQPPSFMWKERICEMALLFVGSVILREVCMTEQELFMKLFTGGFAVSCLSALTVTYTVF